MLSSPSAEPRSGTAAANGQALSTLYLEALRHSPLPFLAGAIGPAGQNHANNELEEVLLLLEKAFPHAPSPAWAVGATLRFNRMIIAEELDFRRRQAYRHSPADAGKINAQIYQSAETMTGYYLAGLLLSYYNWKHHQDLLAFYREEFLGGSTGAAAVMEWGVGHGLLLHLAARKWPSARLLAIDISPHSLTFTRNLLEAAGSAGRAEFRLGDVLDPTLVTSSS